MKLRWRDQHLINDSFHTHGVFAYPTEAVYGLGCDPWDEKAVQHLLEIKQRPWQKGLILVAADITQFDFLLSDLDTHLRQKLEKTWPGPVTWLVPHHNLLPHWITGQHDTVALRVSAHPVIQSICRYLKQPIISTSANLSGHAPTKTLLQVHQQLGDQIVGTISGKLGSLNQPTEIRELMSNKVIRPSSNHSL